MRERYFSLDVFRGATVALMILVNNPGSWANIFTPFEHAPWHGCTPTDLVFPFFLFAVGIAMSFTLARLTERGTAYFLQKTTKRALLIFLIGLFLNWSPFIQWKDDALIVKAWQNIRIFGVLQRIALCYFFASLLVYFFKTRIVIVISVIVLLLYWFLAAYFGAETDPYSLPGYFGTSVDKYLLGENHLYKGEGVPFDPEGIASTMAAIIQVVFGFIAGRFIQQQGKTWKMLALVLLGAALLLFVGFTWDMLFPINKKIWTSSFTVYTTGMALSVIGVLIYLLEFKQLRGSWTLFFDVFGKNPLFIFFLSGFLPRILALLRWQQGLTETGKPIYITPLPWFYQHVCWPLSHNLKVGSLFYAVCMVLFYWFIAYLLNRKKIYIRV